MISYPGSELCSENANRDLPLNTCLHDCFTKLNPSHTDIHIDTVKPVHGRATELCVVLLRFCVAAGFATRVSSKRESKYLKIF